LKVGEIWTHKSLNYDVEIIEIMWDSTVIYLRYENGEVIEESDQHPVKEDEVCYTYLEDVDASYAGEEVWQERREFINEFGRKI